MTTDTPAVHTTTTTRQRPTHRRMAPTRKIALAAGVAYLVTFAASIPQLKLFADVIADPTGYISNPGSNAALQWGSVLEFLTAASGVATAVLLYPVTRRVSRSAAIGFVTSRVVEAALILVGVVAILSVVTLQQHFAGATGAQAQALGVAGESLVAMRQWTFLLGPGVMAGVNDLLLGYILYRSGLVGPRHSDHRPRRRPAHPAVGRRDDPGCLGTGLHGWLPVRPPRRCVRVLRRRVPDRQGLPLRCARRPRRAVRLHPRGCGRGLTSDPLSPAARRPIAPGEGWLPDGGDVDRDRDAGGDRVEDDGTIGPTLHDLSQLVGWGVGGDADRHPAVRGPSRKSSVLVHVVPSTLRSPSRPRCPRPP